MPENTEISTNSVLGIKHLIKEGERLLKQAQKEIESNEKMCDFLRQKAIRGTIIANESLAVQQKILAKAILNKNNIENEIDDLKFSLEIAINKVDLEKVKSIETNPFISEYNEMFAVSSIKAKLDLGNGSIHNLSNTTKGTFDLENANTYNKATGEIVKNGTRKDYNTEFLIRLSRLYILDVKPYLKHHLEYSKNKQAYLDYIKYAALDSEIVKHEGKKEAIRDWLNALPLQQAETKDEQETNITEIQNNFDNVNINDVYKHFKAGLVDKKHLTEQELTQYLKVAFELKTIPETSFNIINTTTKQKVMRVFYNYYKNVAGKPHGKKDNYAALLGNYFEGYKTENVSSNFNK